MILESIFDEQINYVDSQQQVQIESEIEIDAQKQIKGFVQELLTTKSPALKPNYGTTFINDLGEIVNIYKMRYYLQKNADEIKDKYQITAVEITNVEKSGNALIGNLEVSFQGTIKKTVNFQIDWKDRIFTTEAIVE